ncbi:chloroplast stem-loop binding protein of 41 kDa b, chloroplastic [Hordeum vulgare]|nr:chloroplast stem-loop binding protein of 41 kDa b, chloroplastic [Hordeum vulgare]
MGGTRFIGLFCPGNLSRRDTRSVLHLKADRKDFDSVKTSLSAKGFNIVYDINGREATEVSPILEVLPNLEQFIYCSSAGVYLKSDLLPHFEVLHLKGDRKDFDFVKTSLSAKGFNIVYDINGSCRECEVEA